MMRWIAVTIATAGLIGCNPAPGTDASTDPGTSTPDPDPPGSFEPLPDLVETGFSGSIDTSSDGGLFETGRPRVDTYFGGPPPGPDTGPEPDTDFTATCPFGEVADCDDICYPTYLLGDGTCDDGTLFGANFNCAAFNFDDGDCSGAPGTGGCPWNVRIRSGNWANELWWQIQTPDGRVLAEVAAGTYTNFRDFIHSVDLSSGDYIFAARDTFGDGWNGGFFEVINPRTGNIIVTGDISGNNPDGYSEDHPFTLDCDAADTDTDAAPPPVGECSDHTLVLTTAIFGDEVGWSIVNNSGITIAGAPPGTFNSYTSYTYPPLSLPDGYYDFEMFDSWGDGWNGADYVLTNGQGQLVSSGTLPSGSFGSNPFIVNCTDTFDPDLGGPGDSGGNAGPCEDLVFRLNTLAWGNECGFEVRDQATGSVILSGNPGDFANNSTYEWPFPPGTNTWEIVLTDSWGDGWHGGFVEIVDVPSGFVHASGGQSFTNGSVYSFTANVECSTGAGAPGDQFEPGCTSNAVLDCNDLCWPISYLGDGYCDDGSLYPGNFNCEDFDFDDGDCAAP